MDYIFLLKVVRCDGELGPHWPRSSSVVPEWTTRAASLVPRKRAPAPGELQCSLLWAFVCLWPPCALLPNRDIIALVARVVPIYAVSHLFESLAVSIMQWSLKHLYDLCASSDDGEMRQRRGWVGNTKHFLLLSKNTGTGQCRRWRMGLLGQGLGILPRHCAVHTGACYLPAVHRWWHSEGKWEPESWSCP